MSHQIRKHLALLAVSALFAAKAAAQGAMPEAVVNQFVSAWNTHDVKAFDRLFTADAIWVPVAEVRVVGHTDAVKGFEEIHTTWARKTTITAKDTKVQLVRPDVAVILGHAKYLQDGKEVPVLDRAMIFVAVKEADEWKIAAGQLTKQHEGA
jgi:uncharacterized protein (TIGR02246 family)